MNEITQQLAAVFTAANAGQWLLFTALLVGLIVRLLKVNPTLAAKLPPRARPFIAVTLGLLGGVANEVIQGNPWRTALLTGAISALVAILGHQFIIESLLGGKEIGAVTPKDDNGSTGGPPGTVYRDPPAVINTVFEAKDDAPKLRMLLARSAGFLVFRLEDWLHAVASNARHFVKAIAWTTVTVAGLAMFTGSGCSLFTAKNAKSALDAIQIACVFESSVTDEKALADACGVANDLIPILRNLVGQREAAKKAGVVWHRTEDAGADAAEGGAR